MFFSNTRWTQLLAPLEILMSKISLKYIPIHIHNFEHSRVIMNMKLSSHGFLFHRNINRRENKAQIPLIIHHNEKNQRIYFWCAAKDNWASQISEVALRKELEQWKFRNRVAKDSPRTTAGELQNIVESRGQKTLKKIVKQPLHHHMLFGRVSRKIILAPPKTNSSIFSYQTRLELQMGLASMVRWNWKISFLAANI